ncbi:leukocyte elastase inhibitor-like [Sphaeramia orbicularis]|uniref:Serpin B6 n=1 Tax=Sphaeramia orbicularis TaxID=375764 RepID=A0A673CDH7_9TELE|nr:leukocyte elastase inhibitor-like [Sphaeramia orbicularis]XP_029978800.1 leukocyte elastase inhibitor-like [Sphaeramia orbicularis]
MASETNLSKAIASFSQALRNKLSEDDGSANIFFSPFSISSALSMVMLGARGNTAKQMSEVLGFSEVEEQAGPGECMQMGEQMQMPMQMQSQSQSHGRIQMYMQTRSHIRGHLHQQMQMQMQQRSSRLPNYIRKQLNLQSDEDDAHSKFSKLLKALNKPDAEYDLSTANRLYGEQTYNFKEDFIAETKKFYNAMMESVDFLNASEATRIQINTWVEEETKGKIKDLLTSDVVDSSTKMVLVNAIYFKGKWARMFEEEYTVDAQFRINKNDQKPVKLMTQKSDFPFAYIPEVNCQILEMAYKGEELSMIIFLPDEIDDETTGLEKLEKELTYEKFRLWTQMLHPLEIQVKIPRFKMEVAYNLNDVLKRMGMMDAFNVALSNFSGMSESTNLVLSDVVHKAVVDVNEEGTEAAAATAAVISRRSISIPKTFTADHPFLFFIRNNATDTILFSGRFCCP